MAPRTAPPPRRPAPPARPSGRRPSTPARRPAPRGRQQPNLLNYPRAGRRNPWRWLPSLRLVSVLFLLGVIAVLSAMVLAYQLVDEPTEEAVGVSYQTSTVYFSDGTTEMADFAKDGVNRVPLPDGQPVPPNVANAIIAAEDRTFRENRGISVTGLGRAVYGVLTGEDRGGGSTITQQYVKNIYGDDAPTYSRKAREAIIALKLDQRLSKDEVLTRYLDTIYFGRGAYGIQTAADVYFGKPAADLTVPEAALLVGIVPAPSAWDPANDSEQAQERYAYVVNAMVESGTYPAADALANPTMPPTLQLETPQTYAGPRGHILTTVRAELEAQNISAEQIDTGGLKIVTTIDPNLQRIAEETIQDPDVYPTEDRPATLQAGLLSIDPANGEVRAMYAGADYLTRQQNVLTQDRAQAGSTFKPFTLVAALEQGWTLRDTLDGRSPRTFDVPDGDYRVSNFGGNGAGTVNLVQATAGSVNTAYVELNQEVTPQATADVAARAGLPADDIPPFLSNVLGTASVHPWDIGEAYATFAAQGVYHEAHLVREVTLLENGGAVYTADPLVQEAFPAGVAADATVALQAVVEQGSAERYASRLGRPAAGKTGTSQESKAAWFAGFTPQLATTVVLFNPGVNAEGQAEELPIPGFGGARSITGGTWPTAIWERYMDAALEGTEELDFPPGTGTRSSRPAPSPTTSTESPTEAPSPTETPSESPSEEPSAEPTDDGGDEPSEGGGGDGGDGEDGDGGDGGNGDDDG